MFKTCFTLQAYGEAATVLTLVDHHAVDAHVCIELIGCLLELFNTHKSMLVVCCFNVDIVHRHWDCV